MNVKGRWGSLGADKVCQEHRLCGQMAYITPWLCMTLDKSVNLSVHQFPRLKIEIIVVPAAPYRIVERIRS